MKTSMRYLAVIFAVAMLVLTFTSVSADSFTDVTGQTPHYKAIDTLTSYGIIHGYEDNTFRPDLPVRRDEMAKLVYVTATTSVDAGEGVVTFPDVSKNSWAKGYISWCAAKDIVGGYEDGSFKPEGNVTYDEALKMVCAMLGYTDFSSDLWPVDVRVKALIDLELGEGLDGVAGDAVLTRAQVAQLFANSLDEQMYVEPVEQKPGQPIQAVTSPSTLAGDVWGYTQTFAQVVATENWGLKIPTVVNDMTKSSTWENYGNSFTIIPTDYVDYLTFSKTGKDDTVTLRFLDADGNPIIEGGVEKVETLALEDVNLSSYEGKTDDLLAYEIAIMLDKDGEYLSASLKGSTASGVPFAQGSKAYGEGKSETVTYAAGSLKIDGVEYTGENFDNLRRLVYLQDGTNTALVQPTVNGDGRYFINDDGTIRNWVFYTYSCQTSAPAKSDPSKIYTNQNFAWLALMGYAQGPKTAIDANGDGWYDYIVLAPKTPYEVVNVTKKNITLRGVYSAYGDTGKGYRSPTPYEHTYLLENYNSLVIPEKGDIIVGYFVGEEFYCEDTVQKITAFATKKAGNTVSLYGYGAYGSFDNFMPGYLQVPPLLNKMVTDINVDSTFIGLDPNTNDYVYCNYYIYEGKIIYAKRASASESAGAVDAQDKAILLYVDKPTEPQINEKTKKYEEFYPAYLLINGKEELVNLKATNSINGAEAEMVAQDGSMYRAYVKDGIVMYRNLLVTFEVDDDGYYSLKTSGGVDSDVEKDGEVVGKVIAANNIDSLGMITSSKNLSLIIDPATKLMSIVDSSDNVVLNKIIANGSSIIYYPYTKKTTGAHEHIDFYLGNEIPGEFEKKAITGDIYLSKNADGLWVINTTMIGLDGFNAISASTADDYKKDARLHLLALKEKEAEYNEAKNDVFAAYSFKGIYEETDVTKVNEDKAYADSLAVTVNGIYAWDDKEDNYVEIDTSLASYSEETVEDVLADMSLVFTDANTDGYKLLENTKILAIKDVPDNSEEEFLMEYITIDDLSALLDTIVTYNEEESASETLSARIGTYVDENKKTQVAYIIVEWVEFNEELGEYTFAGETK